MSSLSNEQLVESWLRKHAAWNNKKTFAKTTVFTLPLQIFTMISCIEIDNIQDNDIKGDNTTNNKSINVVTGENGLSCRGCQLIFNDVRSQQLHFKSDLHRNNLIKRLQGLSITKQSEYDSSVVESNELEVLSDESDDEDAEDKKSKLMLDANDDGQQFDNMNKVSTKFQDSQSTVSKTYSTTLGPVYFFQNYKLLPSWGVSVGQAMFGATSHMGQREWASLGNPWNSLYSSLQFYQANPIWCVFLLQSGKFAGGIFRGGQLLDDAHKVLRRYTVRAKAGGGQSSHDKKSGKARSAGAMLRRYGEQALNEDIQDLLNQWSELIGNSSQILISAPKTMRSVFFEDTCVKKDDNRIIYVSFPIEKPTLEEVKKVHSKCCSITFSKIELAQDTVSEMNVKENAQIKLNSSPDVDFSTLDHNSLLSPSSQAIVDIDSLTRSIEIESNQELYPYLIEHPLSQQLIEACLTGNDKQTALLVQQLREIFPDRSNKAIVNMPDSLTELRTPLHIASLKGMEKTVFLLLQLGANPSKMDIYGRKPYLLAKDKETRDAFRRYRGIAGESIWNWNSCGVGSALTEDIIKQQKQKEKDKKKRSQQKKKEQKVKDEKLAEESRKIRELEQRTQESEAGNCSNCSKSLYGITSYDVFDRKCCSSSCVTSLRRTLQANAALKRFLN
eukprot:gene5918-8163_t